MSRFNEQANAQLDFVRKRKEEILRKKEEEEKRKLVISLISPQAMYKLTLLCNSLCSPDDW